MGRHTKLTPQIQKEICDTIRATGCKRDAALLAGITEGTLYNWVNRGKQAKSGKYLEFLKAIEKAELQFKNSLVASIRKSGRGDPERGIKPQWQANAWLLERMYPEEFAERKRIDVGNADGKPFRIEEIYVLPDSELAKLAGYEGEDDPDEDGRS